MIHIDFEALNPLERSIHATLKEHSQTTEKISIAQAAEMCGCSVSKISKFCKKLGFASYKQYLDFLYERSVPSPPSSSELARLAHFIETFDSARVDELATLIGTREKLVILGYGPSFYCAQYFEYKFKTCTGKMATAVADELLATSLTDEDTLLIALTVTGRFKSFDDVFEDATQKGAEMAIIVEEYNPALVEKYRNVFCLSDKAQPEALQVFEKSRTVIFIFLEEVIQKLMRDAR